MKLFMRNAVGFYLSARDNAAAGGGRSPYFACIGNVLELSLKAYILQRGGTDDTCRVAIRHDLRKALRMARAHGLPHPEKDVAALIAAIGPYHRNHTIDVAVELAVPPDALAALSAAVRLLQLIAEEAPELAPLLAPAVSVNGESKSPARTS